MIDIFKNKKPSTTFGLWRVIVLFDFNQFLLGGLWVCRVLRDEDPQYAVLHFCFDLVFLDVVGEKESLLESCV